MTSRQQEKCLSIHGGTRHGVCVSEYMRRGPAVDGWAGRARSEEHPSQRASESQEHPSHRSRLLAPHHGRAGRGARSCPSVVRSKEPARIRGRPGTSATSRSARGDDAPHGRAARRSSRFEAAAELRVSLLGDMRHGPRCAPPRRRLAGCRARAGMRVAIVGSESWCAGRPDRRDEPGPARPGPASLVGLDVPDARARRSIFMYRIISY